MKTNQQITSNNKKSVVLTLIGTTVIAVILDKLGIDKVYLLAMSAGESVAIRFALNYPE